MKYNPRDQQYAVIANKQGAVPRYNWGGYEERTPSKRLADVPEHFPQRWQSPLLSWTNYYVPWDRSTLYQWIRLLYSRIKIIVNCWKVLPATG